MNYDDHHSNINPFGHFFVPDKNWFDKEYKAFLNKRYTTMRLALSILLSTSSPDRVILETGCARKNKGNSNQSLDGSSTNIFGQALTLYGGHLHCVDISEKNILVCKEITKNYCDNISYHISDSVHFLQNWGSLYPNKKIDLLYLDSMDYPVGLRYKLGFPMGSRTLSQEHCLAELNAALPHLSSDATILIDDANLPGGGKPALAKSKLSDLGWICLLEEYQTLWRRPISAC